MIVAVTGTPGTGKTSVAEELAELLDYPYVSVTEVAQQDSVSTERDAERDAEAVDMADLVAALDEAVGEDAVLDGHLSHYYEANLAVVLRCQPDTLRERLEAKGWSEEKIEENLDAERLDVVLQEAVRMNEEIVEIDTTEKDAEEVAELVQRLVHHSSEREDHRPGSVAWELPR
ncbi:MAG: adenylate kinase family protein [Candidatus Nanohaloarchaea archaeon]|nr:adenylate kinase family protein [Candidatus Nanohaloarchaea archaeon]